MTMTVKLTWINRPLSSPPAENLIRIFDESPALNNLLNESANYHDFLERLRRFALKILSTDRQGMKFFNSREVDTGIISTLQWKTNAAIRIMDYVQHTGKVIEDPNYRTQFTNHPLRPLWLWLRYRKVSAHDDYFTDTYELFKQLYMDQSPRLPTMQHIQNWMERHPSGLDRDIIRHRRKNRSRILKILTEMIEQQSITSSRYHFEPGLSWRDKYRRMLTWWNTDHFHLKFAIRNPETLNRMLGYTLPESVMELMKQAQRKNIPIFVNPYYLSLLLVDPESRYRFADQPLRDYIFVSKELVEEYGRIRAWEKEDLVIPFKPNAAGWILPTYRNIHRRYPEVAILIPDTAGRACGGLCVSCQRMYEFQSGHLNFNIQQLLPKETWPEKLRNLLKYFENDAQLRDILVTGGDALMSRNESLRLLFDEICLMAQRKKLANESRPDGAKLAEIKRVRLGSRLPVYLPQRITPELVRILSEFRNRAMDIGIEQFIIQTHFESAMEVTPEASRAVERLLTSGWLVTNQMVLTASASRRGHAAKLRKVLNDIGILTYYTFTVKGFMETRHNFAPNARAMQEQVEEKVFGLPGHMICQPCPVCYDGSKIKQIIDNIRLQYQIPFISSDRNVLNMPGVGKSLNFRTIGITLDGRRVLRFDHDPHRWHSPVVKRLPSVIIVESKSVAAYLRQMQQLGEDISEYDTLFGYSIGVTQPRPALYNYPEYSFEITSELTHFEDV